MHDAIKNFHTQFEYEPKMENASKLRPFSRVIMAGMGGSNLVADLLRIRDPHIPITTHRDYGPALGVASRGDSVLHIVSSYSGNTEETLHFLKHIRSKKLPVAVVTSGGKLLDIAKKYALPFVQIPATGIQPRMALGFSIKAVLKLMGREDLLREISLLSSKLHPALFEKSGKLLAKKLDGYVPIIYASNRNSGVAYNWKIKFNETAKIPAFWNVLPELNHNEMNGFDVKKSNRHLSQKFCFVFLEDKDDSLYVQKRMRVLKGMYRERKLPIRTVNLGGTSNFHKMFEALILADWTAYHIALRYGLEPEKVPMVEEFKKLMEE